jgi:hypothetical protein
MGPEERISGSEPALRSPWSPSWRVGAGDLEADVDFLLHCGSVPMHRATAFRRRREAMEEPEYLENGWASLTRW